MKKNEIILTIDIPFAYTTLVAFNTLLKYEDRREIDVDVLIKYRNLLISNALKAHKEIVDNEDIFVKSIDYSKEILLPSDMFYLKGHTLILNDNYTVDDLEKKINDYDVYLDSDIDFVSQYNTECKNLLGISKISKEIIEYFKKEIEIEDCYFKLAAGYDEYKDKMKELLLQRNSFYGNIVLKSKSNLDCFQTEMFYLAKKDNRIYVDGYPIDMEFLEKNIHYDIENGDLLPITQVLRNPYQQAIFDNNSMAFDRIKEDINNLYFDYRIDNCDNNYEEIVSSVVTDTLREYGNFIYTATPHDEMLFYMVYMKKLDEIMDLYGKSADLLKVKVQLLYLMDSISYSLYEPTNFEKYYDIFSNEMAIYDSETLMEIFSYWKNEAYYFLEELFSGKNDNDDLIYKKIALVTTYYELTHDEKIIDLLSKYNTSENYFKYYKLIVGNNLVLRKKKDNKKY